MTLRVLPIEPDRLARLADSGHDDLGNPITAWPVEGWEPLRCCLRIAAPGEQVALIAYRPFETPSPWSEVGPVFVHLADCPGYDDSTQLPDALRTGPRILRTYHADLSLDYADITLAPEGADLEPLIAELLTRPDVALVHVRSAHEQCFTYAVEAA